MKHQFAKQLRRFAGPVGFPGPVGFARQFQFVVVVAFALSIAIMPSILTAAPTEVPSVVGDWKGAMSAGGDTYHLVIHIAQEKDGSLSGNMISTDQSPTPIAFDKIEFKDPALHFEITAIGGIYDGSLNKDKSEIAGHWKQAGQDLELNLTRSK